MSKLQGFAITQVAVLEVLAVVIVLAVLTAARTSQLLLKEAPMFRPKATRAVAKQIETKGI